MPTLHVYGDHSFMKRGYMNGITIVQVNERVKLKEFPTEEMADSDTLHTVYLKRGAIFNTFRADRFKKLKLKTLSIDIDWTRIVLPRVVNNIYSITSARWLIPYSISKFSHVI